MPSHAQARAVQQRDEAVPSPEEGQQESLSSSGWSAILSYLLQEYANEYYICKTYCMTHCVIIES